MIGKPVTAAEWNALLHTTKGEEIVALLAPFHEKPLTCKPFIEGEEHKQMVINALAGIGISYCKGVFGVRCLALRNPSEHLYTFGLEEDVISPWSDTWINKFYRHFHEKKRKGGNGIALYSTLYESLVAYCLPESDLLIQHLNAYTRSGWGTHCLGKEIKESLCVILCYHIALIAMEEKEGLAEAQFFTQLFLQGNFPVGMLNNDLEKGLFLVVTA